jgi:hypothetical protein
MLKYLIAAPLSLLPQRWREAVAPDLAVSWSRATFISGLLICIAGFISLLVWYLKFFRESVNRQADLAMAAMTSPTGPATRPSDHALSATLGMIANVEFLMQPLTWLLIFITLDGLWRAVAAAVTEESVASFPFAVIDRIERAASRRAYEARVPRVADEVRRGDGKQSWDLRVLSCRPKKNWTVKKTIRFEDEFFHVIGESPADATPQRPHAYLLRRVPPHEAFRGLEDYSPHDVLREADDSAGGMRGAIAEMLEAWRIKRLPRVEDQVERGDGSAGWDLRVTSCRVKPLWTRGRSIRFEEVFYRVTGSFDGPRERPYGYTLIRLPENEALRGPMDYFPDSVLYE